MGVDGAGLMLLEPATASIVIGTLAVKLAGPMAMRMASSALSTAATMGAHKIGQALNSPLNERRHQHAFPLV